MALPLQTKVNSPALPISNAVFLFSNQNTPDHCLGCGSCRGCLLVSFYVVETLVVTHDRQLPRPVLAGGSITATHIGVAAASLQCGLTTASCNAVILLPATLRHEIEVNRCSFDIHCCLSSKRISACIVLYYIFSKMSSNKKPPNFR